MFDTAYHPTDAMVENMASQYEFIPDGAETKVEGGYPVEGGTVREVPKVNWLLFGPEYDSGGAGIVTTVDDYAKFVCALANMGTGRNGARILSPAAVDLMRTNQLNEKQLQTFRHNQYLCYGYGLGVRTMMDRTQNGALSSVGEFGWGGAAGATVLADPEKQLAVFYTHHMLNPLEEYYQPRLRNVVCGCL
jgi:CubicO group peptidase (beta-lactamase class C family)